MRICNPQKHNHDIKQSDCFYFDKGEKDESHLLFEMDANTLSGLLGDKRQANMRIEDAKSVKANKVVESICASSDKRTRTKLPRACNSTPSKGRSTGADSDNDDEISDNDGDIDSSFSGTRGGKGSGRRGRGGGRGGRNSKVGNDGGNSNFANLFQDYSGGIDFSDHDDAAALQQQKVSLQQATTPKSAELAKYQKMVEELQARNRQLEAVQSKSNEAGKDISILQLVY